MPGFSHFEGTIHLFQKQVLSVQKQTPYAEMLQGAFPLLTSC